VYSKIVFLIFIYACQAFAELPFKSKEEVDYLSKNQSALSAMTKTKDFQGLIHRPYERSSDLQDAEYYRFAPVDETKVTLKLCEKWLARVIGPLNKITLKVKSIELFKTSTGEACEVQVNDEKDPKSIIPERRIVLGFVKAQPTAIVFKLSKKSDATTQENIRSFWQGLR